MRATRRGSNWRSGCRRACATRRRRATRARKETTSPLWASSSSRHRPAPLQNASLLDRPPAIVPALFQPSSTRTNAEIELSFAPQALRVTVGDSFEARLDIRARTPLSHLPLRLRYDPERIEVTAVKAESFLGDQSEISLMTDSSTPGTVIVGLSRLGDRTGVAGRGHLLALEVRAVGPGRATIAVEQAKPRGPELEALPAPTVRPLEIEIRDVEPPDRGGPETVA